MVGAFPDPQLYLNSTVCFLAIYDPQLYCEMAHYLIHSVLIIPAHPRFILGRCSCKSRGIIPRHNIWWLTPILFGLYLKQWDSTGFHNNDYPDERTRSVTFTDCVESSIEFPSSPKN